MPGSKADLLPPRQCLSSLGTKRPWQPQHDTQKSRVQAVFAASPQHPEQKGTEEALPSMFPSSKSGNCCPQTGMGKI